MTSLMEQAVRENGWNRPAKLFQPEGEVDAKMEIEFLKAHERYCRQTIHLCLECITNQKAQIESLERRRHRLEQGIIPVKVVPIKAVKLPTKLEKMMNDACGVSSKELDEMIRLLEQLAEGGE